MKDTNTLLTISQVTKNPQPNFCYSKHMNVATYIFLMWRPVRYHFVHVNYCIFFSTHNQTATNPLSMIYLNPTTDWNSTPNLSSSWNICKTTIITNSRCLGRHQQIINNQFIIRQNICGIKWTHDSQSLSIFPSDSQLNMTNQGNIFSEAAAV